MTAASEAELRGSVLRLPVVAGTSSGSTPLSAFHRALTVCGVGHYNLIRLSSVIPPGIEVRRGSAGEVRGGWGDRLYCVYADQRTSTPGEQAWAAVGWIQRLDGGGGLLVEHEAGSEDEVVALVSRSLADMAASEPYEFSAPTWVTAGVTCLSDPVAAVVMVPYVTSLWEL